MSDWERNCAGSEYKLSLLTTGRLINLTRVVGWVSWLAVVLAATTRAVTLNI